MAISFTSRVEGNTLVVHASGFDESLEEVQAYGMGVIEACLAGGVTRILCEELDLEYRLGTFDTYQAAEFLSANVPLLARAAVVCQPKHLEEGRFWETVAVNRGLSVRVFTDPEEARRWLLAGEDPERPGAEG